MQESKSVALSDEQCIYVRQLLFQDLHEAAGDLANDAHGASEGTAAHDNLDGGNALSAFRNRVQVVAELLDTVGWSVATDTATIVELETKRGASAA